MDLVWGYCGILSLGHMAFFGLGGYAIGMWLMYERTRLIVENSLANAALPPTPEEITDGIASQIFGVVGDRQPRAGISARISRRLPDRTGVQCRDRPTRAGKGGLRSTVRSIVDLSLIHR